MRFLVAPIVALLLLPAAAAEREPVAVSTLDFEGVPRLRLPEPGDPLSAQAVRGPGERSGFLVRLPGAGGRVPAGFDQIPTPAVAQGLVIVSGGLASTCLYAFEIATGRLAWTSRFADNGPSTVAVTPDRVVTGTESCTVYGVDPRRGARTWSTVIGPSIMTAPAVMGDRVYTVGARTDGGYALVILGLRDGKQVGETKLPCDIVGSPVCGFRSVYLTLASGRVVCLDEAGKLRWERESGASSAPWVDETGLLVALRSAGGPRVLCADPLDGRELWRSSAAEDGEDAPAADPRASAARPRTPPDRPGPVMPVGWAADPPRPAATDELVVLAAGGDLVAFDRETGALRRHLRLPAGRSFHAPPAVLSDRLLYATMDGLLVEISPKLGDFFRALDTGLSVTAQPVVAGGMAFVAGNGVLLAIPWGDADGPEWPQWGGTATRTGR